MKTRVLFFALLLVLCSTLAFAQSEPMATKGTAPNQVDDPDRITSQAYGAGRTALWVPAAAFQPRTGADLANVVYSGVGYVHTNAATSLMWAPLSLPDGALVDVVRFYWYDTSASDAGFILTRFDTGDGVTDMFFGNSTGTGGYGTTNILDAQFTIENFSNNYVLYASLGTDSTLRFKGVRVLYFRQVSPGPGVATFLDVPTSSPIFKFVEALAAAGITGGCGGGNFCPSSPVTRGQMAVFLAQALGLHWSD